MKKFSILTLVLALFALAMPAYAAHLEVSPKVVYHFFDDVSDATGVGANFDVLDVFPDQFNPVVLMTSVEGVSTEENSIQGDAVLFSAGLGYDYAVPRVAGLTVRPYGSLDFASINVDGPVDASNEFGETVGVQVKYDLGSRVSLFIGLGHQWLGTDLSLGSFSQKQNLDNTTLTLGCTGKF